MWMDGAVEPKASRAARGYWGGNVASLSETDSRLAFDERDLLCDASRPRQDLGARPRLFLEAAERRDVVVASRQPFDLEAALLIRAGDADLPSRPLPSRRIRR